RWVSVQTVVRWPPLDRYRSPGRRGQVPCGGVVLRCPSLGLLGAEFEDGVVGCLRVGVGDGGEAAAGEAVESEVAAPCGPFVGLLGQDGTDERDDGLAGGEDPDGVSAATYFLVQPFGGVVRPNLYPHVFRE